MYALSKVKGDVLLIGGYGAGNIGDEAILDGLLQTGTSEINTLTITTHNPQYTTSLHSGSYDFEIRPITPTPKILIKELFTNDEFVIGGGGIFSKYMGPYATKIPYYALAAQAINKPVHWTAIGIYPSTPELTMLVLERALKLSSTVEVRDKVSQDTLQKRGVQTKLVADPATKLSPNVERGKEIIQDTGFDLTRPIIAIGARRIKGKWNKPLQRAYRGIAEYATNNGWQLAYIPFCQHPHEEVEMDEKICRSLASTFQDSKLISYESPQELLGIISQLDALIATRLHSTIFAQMVSTPYVSIEYASKVSSILEEFGAEERGIPLSEVTAESVIQQLVDFNIHA